MNRRSHLGAPGPAASFTIRPKNGCEMKDTESSRPVAPRRRLQGVRAVLQEHAKKPSVMPREAAATLISLLDQVECFLPVDDECGEP